MKIPMLIIGVLGHDSLKETTCSLITILDEKGVHVEHVEGLEGLKTFENLSRAKCHTQDVILVSVFPQKNSREKNDSFVSIFEKEIFDCIVLTDRMQDSSGIYTANFFESLSFMLELIKPGGAVFFNSDDTQIKEAVLKTAFKKISFGFGKDALFTASSIGDAAGTGGPLETGSYVVCLSRPVTDCWGTEISAGEYKMFFDQRVEETYTPLAISSILVYYKFIS